MTWAAAIWLVIVLADLWIALVLVSPGTSWHRPLPELIALVPALSWMLLAVVTVLALLGAGLGRQQWWMALIQIAATVLLALFGILRLDVPAQPQPSPAAPEAVRDAEPIHAMTLNCRFGRANADEIARKVRDGHIDLLALQEVTPELLKRLDAAKIGDELPYRVVAEGHGEDNGGINVILSRVEPTGSARRSINLHASDVPCATFLVGPPSGKQRVMFASAHTYSPRRGTRAWGQGIADIARFPGYARSHGAQDVVVLGDLNANVSHPTFRMMLMGATLEQTTHDRPDSGDRGARSDRAEAFDDSPYALHPTDTLDQGADGQGGDTQDNGNKAAVTASRRPSPITALTDSSLEARADGPRRSRSGRPGGFRARIVRGPATFPAHWHVVPRMLELDHVLHTSGLTCTRLQSCVIDGSDHAALIAELRLV